MEQQPICFVITGFGLKTDYETGKTFNLDLSFSELIKPVFESLGFLCFRTIELNYSGSIERKMYEYILKADFVVADLSTLNPNALYELGVRHALKPFTTIMIGESSLFGDKSKGIPSRLPFDLNHYVVLPYQHSGDQITPEAKADFHSRLEKLVHHIRDKQQPDSPVFDNLPTHDAFTKAEIRMLKDDMQESESLHALLEKAEQLKAENKTAEALDLFCEAKKIVSKYQHHADEYILQRIVLCRYKSAPKDREVLLQAWEDLQRLSPDTSTNTETLGLGGAISKRLYELTGEIGYAQKALKFYRKGYYLTEDYYTGINAAYMYTLLAHNTGEKTMYTAMAHQVYKEVLEIVNAIAKSGELYKRDDTQWLLQTKAEAEYMLGYESEYAKTLIKLEDFTTAFDKNSFEEQMEKLRKMN